MIYIKWIQISYVLSCYMIFYLKILSTHKGYKVINFKFPLSYLSRSFCGYRP